MWFSDIAFGEDLYCFLLGMSLFYIWQLYGCLFNLNVQSRLHFQAIREENNCVCVCGCKCEWETQVAVGIGMGLVVSSCRSSRVMKGGAVDQCSVYINQALSNREVHKGWPEYEGDSIHWFSIFTASSLQILFCLNDKKKKMKQNLGDFQIKCSFHRTECVVCILIHPFFLIFSFLYLNSYPTTAEFHRCCLQMHQIHPTVKPTVETFYWWSLL